MKSRTLTRIGAMTLFATLAIPLQVAGQRQQKKELPHYTVSDIGTLGGTFSEAVGVSNRGSVSGYSTLSGDSVIHGLFWEKGEIIDLGTLGGAEQLCTGRMGS